MGVLNDYLISQKINVLFRWRLNSKLTLANSALISDFALLATPFPFWLLLDVDAAWVVPPLPGAARNGPVDSYASDVLNAFQEVLDGLLSLAAPAVARRR